MNLEQLYRPSLALLTDLYQLTMSYGYWKLGSAARESVFHLFFRRNPFGGGYTVACGLHAAIDYLRALRFDAEDLAFLAELRGSDARPLFDTAFLEHLERFRFTCDVDAVPEGTVVFPHEPLVRVRGPLLEAQLVETALLNLVNFETLIATKATRVVDAAGGQDVIEFGVRRAQGIDGALSASRAAYVGGCAATSNVLAGRLHGIPVRGTHAHSWVMSFDSELEAFDAFARVQPNNCVLLVDTYDTARGVERAAAAAGRLRQRGHEILGVRLDSGDLAELSRVARETLDRAGFPAARIVASNDLDEHSITALKAGGAKIDVWGVGTRLVTGGDQPALGGVYKLAALRDSEGEAWSYRMKLTNEVSKSSNPGLQQVRRWHRSGKAVRDVIYNVEEHPAGAMTAVDLVDQSTEELPAAGGQDLLVAIFRGGELVYEPPALESVRETVRSGVAALDLEVRSRESPQRYRVGLEAGLVALKERLAREMDRAGT